MNTTRIRAAMCLLVGIALLVSGCSSPPGSVRVRITGFNWPDPECSLAGKKVVVGHFEDDKDDVASRLETQLVRNDVVYWASKHVAENEAVARQKVDEAWSSKNQPITVLSQSRLRGAIEQLGLKPADLADTSKGAKAARIAGADVLLMGKIETKHPELESRWHVTVTARLIDVHTGVIVWTKASTDTGPDRRKAARAAADWLAWSFRSVPEAITREVKN